MIHFYILTINALIVENGKQTLPDTKASSAKLLALLDFK